MLMKRNSNSNKTSQEKGATSKWIYRFLVVADLFYVASDSFNDHIVSAIIMAGHESSHI